MTDEPPTRVAVADVAGLVLVDAGARCELWRGHLDGRRVAVKRTAGVRGVDLAVEAGAQRAAAHPHVLPVLAVADDPDRAGAALVLPWVEGGTLADQARFGTRWAPEALDDLLRAVAEAVAAVHRAELAHGDVSPDNVLVDLDGRPLLADFGSATAAPGADHPARAADLAALRALRSWALGALARPHGDGHGRPSPATADVRPVSGPHPFRARTVEVGPAPPRPKPVAPAGRRRPAPARPLLAAAAVAAVLGLGWAGRAWWPRAGAPACAAPAPAPAGPPAAPVADVLGTGCPQRVWLARGVLTVQQVAGDRPHRYRVGHPGDVLLVGRWDCAHDRPALYRPATGELLVYPDLPRRPGDGGGIVPRRSVLPRHADTTAVRVVADRRGCARAVVGGGRGGGDGGR